MAPSRTLVAAAMAALAVAGDAVAGEAALITKILRDAREAVLGAPDDVWKAVCLSGIAERQERIGDADSVTTSEALRQLMDRFHEGTERSFAEDFLRFVTDPAFPTRIRVALSRE
jgi:hypothetical protein